MKKIYLIAMVAAVMCGCNGNKSNGPSAEEIQQMISQAKEEAKAEAKAENEQLIAQAKEEAKKEAKAEYEEQKSSYSSVSAYSSPRSSTSSSASTGDLKQLAYKKGYDAGMIHHTMRLGFYTENDEKQLKNNYMSDCRAYNGLGSENYNNRELYNEYRRGFFKGYEDGNNAL